RKGEMRLVEPRRREAIVTPLVEDKAGVDDAGTAADRRDDLLGPRHLGHAYRVDEADDLDARQPCGGEPRHELGPHSRLEHHGVVLEPVARCDIAHGDTAHTTPSCSSDSSSA